MARPTAESDAPIGAHPTACLHRRAYTTEAAAQSVIFNLRARGSDTERLRAYPCETCSKWHLGREAVVVKAKLPRKYRDVLPAEDE